MASDVIVLIYLFVMLRLDRIDVNYCGIVDHNFVLLGKVFFTIIHLPHLCANLQALNSGHLLNLPYTTLFEYLEVKILSRLMIIELDFHLNS